MNDYKKVNGKMRSRERVLTALQHIEPDIVPHNARLDISLEGLFGNESDKNDDNIKIYRDDIKFVSIDFPGRSLVSIDNFPVPPKEYADIYYEKVKSKKSEGFAVANSYIGGIYEHAKHFLGVERILTDMYFEPEALMKKLGRVFEWLCNVYEVVAEADVDICWMGDDLGTQNSLIMSPDNYRKFYKPYHRDIIAKIKSIKPDMKIAFHSCGHVTPLIPDLISIGVDILESVQPEANNDLQFIKKEYGEHLSFWGAIGTQHLFYDSNADAVKEEVKRVLNIMAKGGGYICSPCHRLSEKANIECIRAFYRTVNDYGAYPYSG